MGKKKNTLLIKWMLGIMVLLMAMAYWTTQQTQSKNQGTWHAGSNVSSQNNFFQFFANLFGIRTQNSSSNGSFNTNTSSSHYQQGSNAGNAPGGNNSGTSGENTSGNLNTADNSQANADQESGNLNPAGNSASADNGTGDITDNQLEMNADNNPGDNLGINAENSPEENPDMNAENNPGENAETSQTNNPLNNSGGNSGNNPNAGCNPGVSSESNPECNSGYSAGDPYQANLPTINPIPSDISAAQSIAQQNQKNASIAALMASRQELVVPILQQAQAAKYQTVNADNIPPVSTNPAPSDIVGKVQSKQINLH